MKILVYYRREQDGRYPPKPDYANEYVRGEDVIMDPPTDSWTAVAEVIWRRPSGQPRDGRLSRPMDVGDVLVNENLDARILTPMGIWARVEAPPVSAVDFPSLGGR